MIRQENPLTVTEIEDIKRLIKVEHLPEDIKRSDTLMRYYLFFVRHLHNQGCVIIEHKSLALAFKCSVSKAIKILDLLEGLHVIYRFLYACTPIYFVDPNHINKTKTETKGYFFHKICKLMKNPTEEAQKDVADCVWPIMKQFAQEKAVSRKLTRK